MLDAIGTRERIKPWVDSALARGERLMGFGHRVYRVRDPRADVLKAAIERLAGGGTDLPFAGEVEAYIRDALRRKKSGPSARHQCGVLHRDPARRAENPAAGVYADLRGGARRRMDRACPRAAARRPADPAEFGLYRADAGLRDPGETSSRWSVSVIRDRRSCSRQTPGLRFASSGLLTRSSRRAPPS